MTSSPPRDDSSAVIDSVTVVAGSSRVLVACIAEPESTFPVLL